jgi:hypothetical protein
MNSDRRNLPHPKDGGVPAGIGFGSTRVAASADIRPEPTFLQGRRRARKKEGACSGVRSAVGWVVRSRVRRRRWVIRLA